MWPRKSGWLSFAILECSLNVWIVNKNVFAAPELCEKCAAKTEVLTSLPRMTSHKPLFPEISNINIFHITQYFWVKSYKHNQWSLPNILAYISGIFDDFFKAGLVPLNDKEFAWRTNWHVAMWIYWIWDVFFLFQRWIAILLLKISIFHFLRTYSRNRKYLSLCLSVSKWQYVIQYKMYY